MGKISLQDLASVLVERWHLGKKEASMFVNEMFFVIQKSLDEDKVVKVKGLGTFKIIDVDDRESVNVNTGDRVLIEGHGKITFTPDALMKELVNKPFSQFETVVLKDGVDFNEAENTVQPEEAAVPDELEDSSAPLVEFVDEPQTGTVEEPQTEVVEEPVAAVKVEEPVKAEKEAPSEEPVAAEEPVAEKPAAEEPAAEESVAEEPVAFVGQDVPEEPEAPEETSGFKKYLKWICIAVLTLAVGILIGYLMGNRSNAAQDAVPIEIIESEAVKSLPADSDSVMTATPEVVEEVAEETEADDAPEVEETQAKTTPETAVEEEPLDKWEAMDVRVRTGAYRILGTDTVVKARAGDNFTRICNRTIGPGMECYLEVYNGIASGTALTVGQEIKIPKVELKKKRKK